MASATKVLRPTNKIWKINNVLNCFSWLVSQTPLLPQSERSEILFSLSQKSNQNKKKTTTTRSMIIWHDGLKKSVSKGIHKNQFEPEMFSHTSETSWKQAVLISFKFYTLLTKKKKKKYRTLKNYPYVKNRNLTLWVKERNQTAGLSFNIHVRDNSHQVIFGRKC